MANIRLLSLGAAGLAALAVSWSIVAVMVQLAPRMGLVDRPNERSLHTRLTPRGGGLGFVLAIVVVLLALAVFDRDQLGSEHGVLLPLTAYVGTALFLAILSLWDDFKSLGSGFRFLCQIAAAGTAVAGIGAFRYLSIPCWPTVDLGWFGTALTIVWIVGLTNVYNFMDGIDGIAGVQGFIGGLAWTAAGIWQGTPEVAILGLMLAGGCLGFLVHNWSPAKIFMGDVGSAFLGYSFGVLPLIALPGAERFGAIPLMGAMPAFALLVMWPFVGDGLYTFLRRARNREVLWLPHRSHLYQRLVRAGWTHAGASIFYAGWGAFSLGVGLMWVERVRGAQLTAAFFPPISLSLVFAAVKWQERRALNRIL
jgi:UDP-N-acetylmuramyl pentapeptide phosphotransferase/UDP-N-acetylglucosamine-1-phosphate transferase